MKFKILKPAELELKEAYDYYESQLEGLGRRFVQAFVDTVQMIDKIPIGWRKVSANTRRINIKGFPYLVLYGIDGEDVIITFICHSHRDPEYYKKHFTCDS